MWSWPAAALAVRRFQGNVHSLPADMLQGQLKRQGAFLDPVLVAPAEESTKKYAEWFAGQNAQA